MREARRDIADSAGADSDAVGGGECCGPHGARGADGGGGGVDGDGASAAAAAAATIPRQSTAMVLTQRAASVAIPTAPHDVATVAMARCSEEGVGVGDGCGWGGGGEDGKRWCAAAIGGAQWVGNDDAMASVVGTTPLR